MVIAKKKSRCVLLLMLMLAPCFGQHKQQINLEERLVLDTFFKVLIEDSEAGYVIYNKKPICVHGFEYKNSFRVNSPSHKESVALREGARLWDQLAVKNANVIVHICDKEEPNIPGYIHILVINVPLFHKIVNKNLSLFQYVLGPAVSSDSLLSALLSNQHNFHSLLKEDRVLIGEVLGFGTQNSLYISRIENIQEALGSTVPPFLQCGEITQTKACEFLPFPPAFGYQSVTEERNDLEGKVTLSSEKLISKNPEFIFGWVKNSKESKQFITELENTQDKIEKLIATPNFLVRVLKKISKNNPTTLVREESYKANDQVNINIIIAKGLWESLKDYDFEYLHYFINGLDNLESQHGVIDRRAWSPHYRRQLKIAQDNLLSAEALFNSLETEERMQCILPRNLYYNIVKQGEGEEECSSSFVKLNYSIFSAEGHCLANQNAVLVNLNNTIPGFAHGIQGMKIRETREIFIHPHLAYGFEASFEQGPYLRTIVTLLDIDKNAGVSLAPLDSIDVSLLKDGNAQIERDENYKKALIEHAREIGEHLQKCKDIDLHEIKRWLLNFYERKASFSTTKLEQDLINRVHWNIYYGNAKEF